MSCIFDGSRISVGAAGQSGEVLTTVDLLTRHDTQELGAPLASTGLVELDELTGGLWRGRVWVIVARPGEGRTTLASQWAVELAATGLTVHLACPREPSRWATARFLACLGRLPLRALTEHRVSSDLALRVHATRAKLAELQLGVYPQDHPGFVPETEPYSAQPRPDVLVIDDADLVGGMTAHRVARYGAEAFLVIVTLPRHLVVRGDGDEAPIDPLWGRVADVIVEVRHRHLPPRTSPTALDEESAPVLRPGEADLVVRHHRWGPVRTLGVGFQGHYARFVNLG
jgi:replicative DNA helicase